MKKKIDAIKEQLKLKTDSDSKKTPEERAAEKEKLKKEWAESPEELKLRGDVKAIREQIKDIKKQKIDLKEQNEKEIEAFYVQKREMDKIEYMWDIMDRLKHEDKKKKAAEEHKKRVEEELKKAKEHLLFKYQREIDVCDYLLGFIEQEKLLKKMKDSPVSIEDLNVHKVNEDSLKKENLLIFKPKKDEEDGVKPGQKKPGKKPKKTAAVEPEKIEEVKFKLDVLILENFQTIKITPPSGFEEFENVGVLITDKKTEYLTKRKEEIDHFDANPPNIKIYADRPDFDGERKRGPRRDRDDGPREDRRRDKDDGQREDRRRNRDEEKVEDDHDDVKKKEIPVKSHPSKKIVDSEELFPKI